MVSITEFLGKYGGKLINKVLSGAGKGILETASTSKIATRFLKSGAEGLTAAERAEGKDAFEKAAENTIKNFKQTKSGKVIDKLGRAGGSILKMRKPLSAFAGSQHANKIMYPVIGAAFVGGLGYGVVESSIQRSIQRNQMDTNRGMSPNNLGTDGLTLSLSKIRHR